MVRRIFLLWLLLTICISRSLADPSWEVVVEPDPTVTIDRLKWFERDEGWLLTCYVSVGSQNLIKGTARLLLEGYAEPDEDRDESELQEPIWTKSRPLRRKDFDKKLGSRDAMLARVHLSEAPEAMVKLSISFLPEVEVESGE